MQQHPITADVLEDIAQALRVGVNNGMIVKVTCAWTFENKQIDTMATWTGEPKLVRECSRRSTLYMVWENTQGQASMFPAANVKYYSFTFAHVGEVFPGTIPVSEIQEIERQERARERAAQDVSQTPQPEPPAFTIGDVTTWSMLDGSHSELMIQTFLHQTLELHNMSDNVRMLFATLMSWVRVCLAAPDWRVLFGQLGNDVLRNLRTAQFRERGGDIGMVVKAMKVFDDPKDILGIQMAKAEATSMKKPFAYCTLCKRPGHYAAHCYATLPSSRSPYHQQHQGYRGQQQRAFPQQGFQSRGPVIPK
jgi:hypothetical protein